MKNHAKVVRHSSTCSIGCGIELLEPRTFRTAAPWTPELTVVQETSGYSVSLESADTSSSPATGASVASAVTSPHDVLYAFISGDEITTSNSNGVPTSGAGWSRAYSHDGNTYYNVLVAQLSLPNTDGNGHTLTYSVVSGPDHGALTFDPASGLFIEEIGGDFRGIDHFSFNASNGTQTSDTIHVTFALNATMVATSSLMTFRDWLVTLGAPADNGSMTISSDVAPQHGYAEMYDHDMLYLSDGVGPTDEFNVDWTFLGLQAKPIVVSLDASYTNSAMTSPIYLTYDVAQGSATTFSSTQTNITTFGEDEVLSLAVDPSHGTLSLGSTGGLTYTPTSNESYQGWDFAKVLITVGNQSFSQWIQFNVGLNVPA